MDGCKTQKSVLFQWIISQVWVDHLYNQLKPPSCYACFFFKKSYCKTSYDRFSSVSTNFWVLFFDNDSKSFPVRHTISNSSVRVQKLSKLANWNLRAAPRRRLLTPPHLPFLQRVVQHAVTLGFFPSPTLLLFFGLFRSSFARILFISPPANWEKSQNSTLCWFRFFIIKTRFTLFLLRKAT